METFFIKAAQLFLALSILVVLHELGHFIPAKLFKTKVEKFYLFFDVKFSLFKKKIGETVYGIGWLPLGGYVKIAGMIDESMDKEQMAQPPQPWEFRSKPAWQRLIIMLGGVTVNFLLAFVIYIFVIYTWGETYVDNNDLKYGLGVSKTMETIGFEQGDKILSIDGVPYEEVGSVNSNLMFRTINSIKVLRPNGETKDITIPEDIGTRLFESGDRSGFTRRLPFKVDSIQPDFPAIKAGFKLGDQIVSIDGYNIDYDSDYAYAIKNRKDSVLNIKVSQNGVERDLKIQPNEDSKLGLIIRNTDTLTRSQRDFSFAQSITKGASMGYWTISDYLGQFKYIFTKKGAKEIGGFAAIGQLFPSKWNWQAFWMLTAFLSVMLAVLNLLPIPALDGGHVMFLLYEMISGRKPSEKFLERAQIIGFFILIALVLYANGNDIFKAITG
ncbi:MAG: RIP metalloprotease RseP [Winogradskyella sp.]|nr:RIP metalloprotease RseP [Winogradskyella sp.]RNC88278.1 MAG: RIP metalloprotease RseP [Winogradskyella sp.]